MAIDDDKRPRIEYPCAYPIKVMGTHENDFALFVVEVVKRHDPDFVEETIELRESSNGRYLSVTVTITAQGPEHIQALFEDLKKSGRVAMVL